MMILGPRAAHCVRCCRHNTMYQICRSTIGPATSLQNNNIPNRHLHYKMTPLSSGVHEPKTKSHFIGSKQNLLSVYIVTKNTIRMHNSLIDGTVNGSGIRPEPPWRIMFFGTDEFSLECLKAMNNSRKVKSSCLVENLEVVAINKKCPVRKYAEEVGLAIHTWPHVKVQDNFDVGVVASFGHLIPHKLIQMFPYGVLNIHPSLLPRWRGASPIIHTLLNGDEVTGVTVTEIRPRHFDIGPILIQEPYYLTEKFSSFELRDILALKGAQLLLRSLLELPVLERYEQEQDPSGITYAHKIKRDMAIIDWHDTTRREIDRQYRALHELHKLRSEFNGHTIKLLDMVDKQTMEGGPVVETVWKRFKDHHVAPGTTVYNKHHNILCISCKDGWVGFRKIIMKKTLTADAFNSGYIQPKKYVELTSRSNSINKYIFRMRI